MVKKWVYGTRTKKWYLVGPKDRDYAQGISQVEMKRLGKSGAKQKFLAPGLMRNPKKRTGPVFLDAHGRPRAWVSYITKQGKILSETPAYNLSRKEASRIKKQWSKLNPAYKYKLVRLKYSGWGVEGMPKPKKTYRVNPKADPQILVDDINYSIRIRKYFFAYGLIKETIKLWRIPKWYKKLNPTGKQMVKDVIKDIGR